MDLWKYYDITHKMHLICNPMAKEKLYRLCSILPLRKGSRVLDIACGKGEFLVRLAELHGVSGVGVDLSPYCIRDCLRKKRERVPEADLVFMEMDGAEYTPEEKYQLAGCLGASWVYSGYRGTLQALQEMTTPEGWIVAGEPFWRRDPSDGYLESQNMKREEYGSHVGNVRLGEELGLRCVYILVSDEYDWDHYETLQWLSAEKYVAENPDDPDNEELLLKVQENKDAYLDEGRSALGWAIYVFKKRG